MGPAERDRHPSDPHRERVPAERPQMKRLDHHALIEAKLAEAATLGVVELAPANLGDPRRDSDAKLVEPDREGV